MFDLSYHHGYSCLINHTIMNYDVLLNVVSEWLDEPSFPHFVTREVPKPLNVEKLVSILAIVGPRRSGKTTFMYQLIKELLGSNKYSRSDILFVDFEDYRLIDFRPNDMEALFTAFQQKAGKNPLFLLSE